MPKINVETTDLINLVSKGLDNKEIASELGIGVTSVKKLLKQRGVSRDVLFNVNRTKAKYFSRNAVETHPTDSEFFEIYKETSIDDILFK